MTHVIHEIPPVYDDRSKILILGSFPSVKSREGQFFYHHKQNRFWKVLAAVAGTFNIAGSDHIPDGNVVS